MPRLVLVAFTALAGPRLGGCDSARTPAPAPAETSALPPLGAAATALAEAWSVPAPESVDQGTLHLNSRMHAWYAVDTFARGPMPAIEEALASGDRDQAAEAWLKALAMLAYRLEPGAQLTAGPTLPVPEALADAIDGEVLLAEEVEGLGWVVVGGTGHNGYDMTVLAGVFDPSGNDTYMWGDRRPAQQAVIDVDGDDQYVSDVDDHCLASFGPAIGIHGTCVIMDLAGDDEYRADVYPPVTAIDGFALLLDRGGDDWLAWDMSASVRESPGTGLALLVKDGGTFALLDLSGSDAPHRSQLRATALLEVTPAGWAVVPGRPAVPLQGSAVGSVPVPPVPPEDLPKGPKAP